MKLIYTALLLLVSITCRSKQPDYTEIYFPSINKAELLITQQSYADALKEYQKAFNSVTLPFARDYFNAASCAVKVKNWDASIEYYKKLLSKRVSSAWLESHQAFEPLRATSQWKKFKVTIPTLLVEMKSQRNLKQDSMLTLRYERLVNNDNALRRAPGSYQVYGEQIKKIDEENIKELIQSIDEVGFPNENQIFSVDLINSGFPAYVVILHHFERVSLLKKEDSKKEYSFINTFYKAVKNGQLDPHHLSYFIGFESDTAQMLGASGAIRFTVGDKKSGLLVPKMSSAQTMKIDVKRELNGLEKSGEFYEKIIFADESAEAANFIFHIYERIEEYQLTNEKEYDQFVSSMIEIKSAI